MGLLMAYYLVILQNISINSPYMEVKKEEKIKRMRNKFDLVSRAEVIIDNVTRAYGRFDAINYIGMIDQSIGSLVNDFQEPFYKIIDYIKTPILKHMGADTERSIDVKKIDAKKKSLTSYWSNYWVYAYTDDTMGEVKCEIYDPTNDSGSTSCMHFYLIEIVTKNGKKIKFIKSLQTTFELTFRDEQEKERKYKIEVYGGHCGVTLTIDNNTYTNDYEDVFGRGGFSNCVNDKLLLVFPDPFESDIEGENFYKENGMEHIMYNSHLTKKEHYNLAKKLDLMYAISWRKNMRNIFDIVEKIFNKK
jgi:hypothetical protein